MLNRSRHFAHVTTVLLSWRVQNFVVIGSICYEQEHYKISSISNTIEISLVGPGAWSSKVLQWLYSKIGHQDSSTTDGHWGNIHHSEKGSTQMNPISQIPQRTSLISHKLATMHNFVTEMCTCVCFCYTIVHCGIYFCQMHCGILWH